MNLSDDTWLLPTYKYTGWLSNDALHDVDKRIEALEKCMTTETTSTSQSQTTARRAGAGTTRVPATKEQGSDSSGPRTSSAPALSTQVGGNHYKLMKFQPAEYIHANGLGFIEGNVIKYVSRWRHKNGLDDLRKAQHMLGMLIELEERKDDRTA